MSARSNNIKKTGHAYISKASLWALEKSKGVRGRGAFAWQRDNYKTRQDVVHEAAMSRTVTRIPLNISYMSM